MPRLCLFTNRSLHPSPDRQQSTAQGPQYSDDLSTVGRITLSHRLCLMMKPHQGLSSDHHPQLSDLANDTGARFV